MQKHSIVIVGAGTGGTIIANRLYKTLKSSVEITLIDPSFEHYYQPGFLFSMFGRENNEKLKKDSRSMLPKSVITVEDKVVGIDTKHKIVKTSSSGELAYDFLVLATGSNIATGSVDWWDDSIHQFYTPEGSEKLAKAIQDFEGGTIVVSIADLPYKCPPAPIEAAMLLDDYFRDQGKRDEIKIIYTSPLGRAFSIETTNKRVEEYLKEKDIELITFFNTDEVDTEEKVVYSVEGDDIDYDMLIMIPPHQGQRFLVESGIAKGKGWIPTDRHSLKVHNQDQIYALGDATDIPTSKAGSTAHHQAPVIAENILKEINGEEPTAKYDGHVQCFFLTEFGKSMFINFDYENPPKPSPTRRMWYWFKLMFKSVYFRMVTKARI